MPHHLAMRKTEGRGGERGIAKIKKISILLYQVPQLRYHTYLTFRRRLDDLRRLIDHLELLLVTLLFNVDAHFCNIHTLRIIFSVH